MTRGVSALAWVFIVLGAFFLVFFLVGFVAYFIASPVQQPAVFERQMIECDLAPEFPCQVSVMDDSTTLVEVTNDLGSRLDRATVSVDSDCGSVEKNYSIVYRGKKFGPVLPSLPCPAESGTIAIEYRAMGVDLSHTVTGSFG